MRNKFAYNKNRFAYNEKVIFFQNRKKSGQFWLLKRKVDALCANRHPWGNIPGIFLPKKLIFRRAKKLANFLRECSGNIPGIFPQPRNVRSVMPICEQRDATSKSLGSLKFLIVRKSDCAYFRALFSKDSLFFSGIKIFRWFFSSKFTHPNASSFQLIAFQLKVKIESVNSALGIEYDIFELQKNSKQKHP